MNLSDLIQKHLKEVETDTREAVSPRRPEADLGLPAAMIATRIERVDQQIAMLEGQRAESERRLSAAIEEQKRLRIDLEREAKAWGMRRPPGEEPGDSPRPPREGASAKGTSRASRSPRQT